MLRIRSRRVLKMSLKRIPPHDFTESGIKVPWLVVKAVFPSLKDMKVVYFSRTVK
ncbi:hypothetical protein SAMN04488112_102199 [Melghirimyces thermohalophilus]|uniref:Uncharacterized protein n=1 Tax=Melghirimyces thermohalophilus TaxID=1236220 RepID=A0A1G6IEL0_9BACL|nr:hypothetical protein SAMN04488112_102199 [Melghirimyces thermohalophilus]